MKTFYRNLILIILSTCVSQLALASTAEFSISNDFLNLNVESRLSNSVTTDVSFIHSDVDGHKNNVLGLGLYAYHQTQRLKMHLGGQPYYFDGHKVDGHGIALGGGLDFYFIPKAYVGAELLFAPDILTGGDFENYIDTHLKLGFQLLPNADIFLGYRFVEAEQGKFDYEIYKGGFLGFSIDF